MDDSGQQSSSLMASVQRMGETLLSTFRNRLELFSLELQEEKERAVAILVAAAAAIFFTFLAIIVVTLTVVAFVPETSRPFVLLGFSLLYVLLAAGAVVMLRKKLRGAARPFSDSVAELKKDLSVLRHRP